MRKRDVASSIYCGSSHRSHISIFLAAGFFLIRAGQERVSARFSSLLNVSEEEEKGSDAHAQHHEHIDGLM